MKRSINKLQVIPASIYPSNIYVFKGFSFNKAEEHLDSIYPGFIEYVPPSCFDTRGYTILLPDGSIVIILRDDTDIPIIAHEAFHATEFIMDRIGCTLTNETSEPYAYLLGYIVEQIVQ